MKYSIAFCCLILCAFGCAAVRADDIQDDMISEIREVGTKYVEAFNSQDAKAVAAFWSPEAVYINRLTGEQVVGRDAIAAQFEALFESAEDLKINVDVESIDFVSPNVAVENGQSTFLSPDDEPEATPYSAVYIRRDGKWMLDRVTDKPEPKVASHYEQLKPLQWIVGDVYYNETPVATEQEYAMQAQALAVSAPEVTEEVAAEASQEDWLPLGVFALTEDGEARERALAFIRRNAEAKKPFMVSWWPLMFSFITEPQKTTIQRGMVGEEYNRVIEPDIAQLRATLAELGIAENTLIIAMADNGPMTHNPPPGAGLGEGLFRGGKGDFTEGGVRVCAAALWPGMIEAGQVAGDMIHEADLFTTFARLAGATEYIPTDRIIDGMDQTSLLLKGDTHGRRDHVFIYQGPDLAASVKDQYKMHWTSNDPSQAKSGITAVYDLYNDHREVNPIVVGGFHMKEPFERMRARHELWKKNFPDRPVKHGAAYTGISNARPATLARSKPPLDMKALPFDPLEFIDHLDELPFDPASEPGPGE